jgi:hypothetical protein
MNGKVGENLTERFDAGLKERGVEGAGDRKPDTLDAIPSKFFHHG